MKIFLIIRIYIKKIRVVFFPTLMEKEKERWLKDHGEELRYNYDMNGESLIMDVGGYKGQWSSDIYSMYNCHIMIFEPVYAYAQNISKRFRNNLKIEVFQFALGRNKRCENIGMSNDGSSVFDKSSPKEIIQFEDVLNFFNEKDIKTVDLMKINIEGGEYELLSRMIESGLINRVKSFQIQFHDFVPEATIKMDQIYKELLKSHFPTYQYKFVWENWVRNDK